MKDYGKRFASLRDARDYAGIMQSIPYARTVGMTFSENEHGDLLFHLPFYPHNIANTLLNALFGGVIGGFLENCALLQLMWVRESQTVPRTIDYLRSGRAQSLYAQCELTKLGKRVAHVQVTSWQDDPAQPVAVARGHFLLL